MKKYLYFIACLFVLAACQQPNRHVCLDAMFLSAKTTLLGERVRCISYVRTGSIV